MTRWNGICSFCPSTETDAGALLLMTMNPLPPQAYTKETLLKAYQWLMGQNSSLKDIATTPDILVSLYLKATRDGDSALERPSILNFKNELRSLAGMMGELDRPAGASSAHMIPPQASLPQQQSYVQAQVVAAHSSVANASAARPTPPAQPTPQIHSIPHSQGVTAPSPTPLATQTQVSYTEKTLTATTQTSDLLDLLDCTTLAMIQEVKGEFNLSSEAEALRMLVKIGFTRSKNLIS